MMCGSRPSQKRNQSCEQVHLCRRILGEERTIRKILADHGHALMPSLRHDDARRTLISPPRPFPVEGGRGYLCWPLGSSGPIFSNSRVIREQRAACIRPYGRAALDWFRMLHTNSEEWIFMHCQGWAARSPLAARNRADAHTRRAHTSRSVR